MDGGWSRIFFPTIAFRHLLSFLFALSFDLFFQGLEFFFPSVLGELEFHRQLGCYFGRLLVDGHAVLELFLEPVNTPGGVQDLLLARIERMTARTDVHLHPGHHTARLNHVAACALDGGRTIFRMNVFFHFFTPLLYSC